MEREYLIGIDLGGNEIDAGLVDLNGKIVKKITMPLEERMSRAKIIDSITFAINKLRKDKVLGIGIGIPGPVDFKKGIALNPTNLPCLKNTSIKRIIEDRTRIPVSVENDANCFAIAAHKVEFERIIPNVIGVLIDEGIGAGIIINGKIYRGYLDSAGELGHMTVADNKVRCSCGSYDCLNLYASLPAIEKTVFRLTKKKMSLEDITRLAKKDSRVKSVIRDAAEHLGTALANTVRILNPEMIVLNGPVSALAGFVETTKRFVQKKTNGTNVTISRSSLEDSGILGAASIVF